MVKLNEELSLLLKLWRERVEHSIPTFKMDEFQSVLARYDNKKRELDWMVADKIPGRWRVGACVNDLEKTLEKLYADAAKKAPKKTDIICCAECAVRLPVRDTWVHPEQEDYALAEFLADRVCYSCVFQVNNRLMAEQDDPPYSPEPDYDPYDSDEDRPHCPCRDWECPGDCGTQSCGHCIDVCRCEPYW